MKNQHTPGPWETGCVKTSVEILPEGWRAPLRIADCHTKNAPESEAERVANARLIAAAPELLEACQFVAKYALMKASKGDPLPSQLTGAIAAAIAKADAE